MDRKVVALVCGAVGGCVIGAGYLLWRIKCSHGHHHGHGHGHGGRGHGPFDEDGFISMWTHTQFENETEILDKEVSLKDGVKFYTQLSEFCRKHKNDEVVSRALDIGCSLGRTSFDLAQYFNEVIGIDTSVKSIDSANQLKAEGRLSYKLKVEGEIVKDCVAIIKPEIDRNKVQFQVADACSLSPDLGQFGMIIAINTIHHVPDPMKFLTYIKDFLVPGGILVVGEIYSWHEMMELPKDRWVAGYVKEDGHEVHGPEGLRNILSPSFDLLEEKEMQIVSRWSRNMYMVVFPEITVWKKK